MLAASTSNTVRTPNPDIHDINALLAWLEDSCPAGFGFPSLVGWVAGIDEFLSVMLLAEPDSGTVFWLSFSALAAIARTELMLWFLCEPGQREGA